MIETKLLIKQDAYAAAGVDVDVEAEASRIMYEASKATFKNRKGSIGEIIAPFDDFAAIKMVPIGALPDDSYFSVGFDTAGTKVEITERVGVYNTIAYDLFAMVCDDAIMRGGEPVLVGTTLDLRTLGSDSRFLPIIQELADGYVAAAHAANVAVINGEIVQMGSLLGGYGDFPYHWGAACVWFARKNKLFTGREIQVGDSVVMLQEHGFRTNGFSLLRKIFKDAYGDAWHTEPFEDSTLGMQALMPASIYSRLGVALHGGFDTPGTAEIHGMVHITGGGIPEKMRRALRVNGLGAKLPNLFELPKIMSHCQKIGKVPDRDAYRAWNMGQGMAVITPEPQIVIAKAKEFFLEARIAGTITPEPSIVLTSRGIEMPGSPLIF